MSVYYVPSTNLMGRGCLKELAPLVKDLGFNNAIHAMAHQLGGVYDLPHGVCNAMLLPIVERENAKCDPRKFRAIAKAAGLEVAGKTDDQCAEEVIEAIKALS